MYVPPPSPPYSRELTPEERRLADSAAHASREAVKEAFAAGLSITVLRGNRIVRVAPDGTETLVEVLQDD